MATIDVTKLKAVDDKTVTGFEFNSTDVYLSNVTYYDSESNEVKAKPNICSGYHVTNFSPPSPSNFYYPDATHTYRSMDIFITKQIHTISNSGINKPITGELIIKHVPTISSDPIIYLCFFFTNTTISGEQVGNDIDDLLDFLENRSPNNLNLSIMSLIPKQTQGVLCDTLDAKMIIFTNPIYVKNQMLKLTEPKNLFIITNDVNESLLLKEKNIIKGIDKGVYMECAPTGESQETIQTYNVPVHSEYSQNASKLATMNMAVNFTSIVAVVFITYAVFPSIYITYIYESVKKHISSSDDLQAKRLDTIEIFYTVLIAVFIIINFVIGFLYMEDGGWTNILLGLGTGFIYILTNSIIGFTRMANKDTIPYNGPFSFMDLTDIGVGLTDFFKALSESKRGWAYWAPMLLITGFALLSIAGMYDWKLPPLNEIKPATFSNFIIIPFYMYLLFLISYVMAKYADNSNNAAGAK
jgi:hypothetical protein